MSGSSNEMGLRQAVGIIMFFGGFLLFGVFDLIIPAFIVSGVGFVIAFVIPPKGYNSEDPPSEGADQTEKADPTVHSETVPPKPEPDEPFSDAEGDRDAVFAEYAAYRGEEYLEDPFKSGSAEETRPRKIRVDPSEQAPVPPVNERKEPPAPQKTASRRGSTVEVSAISAFDMGSFAFYVDGRVVGYIGPNKSTFSVPSGMHEAVICINDPSKKVIYKENILFNTAMFFTVKKKMGGFTVLRQ